MPHMAVVARGGGDAGDAARAAGAPGTSPGPVRAPAGGQPERRRPAWTANALGGPSRAWVAAAAHGGLEMGLCCSRGGRAAPVVGSQQNTGDHRAQIACANFDFGKFILLRKSVIWTLCCPPDNRMLWFFSIIIPL